MFQTRHADDKDDDDDDDDDGNDIKRINQCFFPFQCLEHLKQNNFKHG